MTPLTRVARLSTAFLGSNLARAAIGFGLTLAIGRGLGAHRFGQWVVCTTWASLLTIAADLGFGVLSSRIVADYVRAKLKDGGDVPQIPPMRIGGELTLERGALSSGVSVTWYDKQDKLGPEELPTDGSTMVNLDLSYKLPHSVFVYLRGENLLDEDARRHSSPLKDVAPLPGRGVGAGVRMEL